MSYDGHQLSYQRPSAVEGWPATRDHGFVDERFSDHDSFVTNPLDDRFSEPESSVAGEVPLAPLSQRAAPLQNTRG